MNYLKEIAARRNITIPTARDAEDYLRLLRADEAILKHLGDSSDYIHPSLLPQDVVGSRKYWKPSKEDNPLNAWSHRCHLLARQPTDNLLQGRTVAIKDNISIAGLPTTLGTFPELLSTDSKFPISEIDAPAVSRILKAGGLIIGSATCENFIGSPLSYTSATGPVHNPRAHGFTVGGSSSGPATLVAAQALAREASASVGQTVDMAIGGDQGGSIRLPASYTGVYGMKPTHGLIPYTGVASLFPMLDHLGPIASTLENIAVLLQVLAGYDGLDARMTAESPLRENVKSYSQLLHDFSQRKLAEGEKIGSSLKIGLLTESLTLGGVSEEVRNKIVGSTRAYYSAAGAEVVDISVPMHKEGSAIFGAATRSSMADWAIEGRMPGYLTYSSPHLNPPSPPGQKFYDLLTPTNPGAINVLFTATMVKEKFGPRVEAKAHRKIFELRAAYDRALEEVDVLITPCAPTVAMPHPNLSTAGEPESTVAEKMELSKGVMANTCPFNITGHPALNVPCGFGSPPRRPDLKLPIGLQIVGRRWDDETVLKAAAVFEEGCKMVAEAS